MKGLITISIDDPSSGDLKNALRTMMKFVVEGKSRINNGASIKITACNPEDAQDLNSHLGKTVKWALGKESRDIPTPNAEYRKTIRKMNPGNTVWTPPKW